jgi:hypothetical protein
MAFLVDAVAEANHLAQSIDDYELVTRLSSDHHVETVGAEIDGREDISFAWHSEQLRAGMVRVR